MLDAQGTTCDLSHIIASVNKSVSEKIFSYRKSNVAQCPEAVSTLCQRFTFGNIGEGQGEGFLFFNFALLLIMTAFDYAVIINHYTIAIFCSVRKP